MTKTERPRSLCHIVNGEHVRRPKLTHISHGRNSLSSEIFTNSIMFRGAVSYKHFNNANTSKIKIMMHEVCTMKLCKISKHNGFYP